MTGPAVTAPDDPIANARALRAAGASIDQIRQYLTSKGYSFGDDASTPPPTTIHAQYASGQLARRMAAENAEDSAESGGGFGTQVLGTIAALGRDIYGADAAQSAATALANHIPYAQARRQIHDAEDAAVLDTPARLAGAAVAAGALPASMSPAMQGAAYGAASGALQSDPNAGLQQRAGAAAIGGVTGAAAGKLGENLSNAVRSLFTKRLGQQALTRQAIMQAADEANYGKAIAEAKIAGGTSPQIQQILSNPSPTLAPYLNEINASESLQGADDATRLLEAYKLMSERQGMLQKRIIQAPPTDFKAGSSLERRDIGMVKGELQRAAGSPSTVTKPPITFDVPAESHTVEPQITPGREPLAGPVGSGTLADVTTPPNPTLSQALRNFQANRTNAMEGPAGPGFQLAGQSQQVRPGVEVNTPAMRVQTAPAQTVQFPAAMPSLRQAIAEHARLAGIENAAESGQDAALRAITDRHVAGGKQLTQSPDAFLNMVQNATPWSGQPMTPAEAQAALQGVLGRNKEFLSPTINPKALFSNNSSAVAPFVRALDQQAGGAPLGASILRAYLTSQGHPSP